MFTNQMTGITDIELVNQTAVLHAGQVLPEGGHILLTLSAGIHLAGGERLGAQRGYGYTGQNGVSSIWSSTKDDAGFLWLGDGEAVRLGALYGLLQDGGGKFGL